MIRIQVCTNSILRDLGNYGFTKIEQAGFFFYLGYCTDYYAISQGLFSRRTPEPGMMNDFPTSFYLSEEDEIEDNQLDSDSVRTCFITFAKVIQEEWFKDKRPLSTFINIGPNYLFTDEISEEIWKFNAGKTFIGRTIDEGYLHFFKMLGTELYDNGISEVNDCIWYGRDLYHASIMDDPNSYKYVVDKLITLMPPCLKIFLTYPYEYWKSSYEFHRLNLFTRVFKSALNLEENDTIKETTLDWFQKAILDESGRLLTDFDFRENSPQDLLLHFTTSAIKIKKSLTPGVNEEIYNEPSGFDLDITGQVIELPAYIYLIKEIVRLNYDYDFNKKNWANRGMMMQYFAFYFITAVRFSVYPKDVI
jgi:hypothetical protein